jgi:mannose-6-phosphate isomerase-like protein (cupin superfamily)
MGNMMPTKPKPGNISELIGTAVQNAPNKKASSQSYIARLLRVLETTRPSLGKSRKENPNRSPDKYFMFSGEQTPFVAPIMSRLQPELDRCEWFCADTFYPEDRYRGFSEKVWGSQILGHENGLFSVDEKLIALLILIEANTTYPLHAHRIEELYLVLAGEAEWSRDGESWERLGPGMVFHNPPWGPHTMRTGTIPVAAFGLYLPPFGWEGGLI